MLSSQRSQAKSTHSNTAIAAAKKAALVAEVAALKEHRALEEQELYLKHDELAQQRRQDEEKLRLKQRKHQLRLETEIAKAEAEERAYAIIETLRNYDELPSQLHNPVLRHERRDQFEPQPEMTKPNQDPHQLTKSDNYIHY